jgi:hypothetical protein
MSMAEIRCPMCGKLNPADLDICQFCFARLKPVRAAPAEPEPGSPESSQGSDGEEIPEWLRSFRGLEDSLPKEPRAEEGPPDWLTGFRDEQEQTESSAAVGKTEEEGFEDPFTEETFRSDLFGRESIPDDQSWLPETEAGEELPDWLASSGRVSPESQFLDDPEFEEPESNLPFEEPDEPAVPANDEPEWLLRIRSRQQTGSAEIYPEDAGNQAAESLEPEETDTPAEPEPEATLFEDEELSRALSTSSDLEPDWLQKASEFRHLEPQIPQELPAEGTPGSPFALSEDQEDLEEILSGDAPDWLAGIEPSPGSDQLAGAEIFDQYISEGPVLGEADSSAAKPESAFEPDDFRDLFKANPEQDETPKTVFPSNAQDSGLAPASLPGWMEAMRPIDLPPENIDESGVERVGPLSGLRGVLPAEPDISQIQKPPAYQAKLQVTESQQTSAALFQELIKAEGEPKPLVGRPALSPQHLLRVLFALVLFAAVLFPLITGEPQIDIPLTNEVIPANEIVNSISSGDPVLVAFDYDPGWSGEMDAAAGALIDHLMLKGAYLSLVSTSPVGPLQAERVLAMQNAFGQHQYRPPTQYINLGFIPGGTAGLQSFSQTPRDTLAGGYGVPNPWEEPALQNIQSLEDFALFVLLTENPDTARAWIEQVEPALGETPVLMVVSAQAEPLVRPYYDAVPRQVDGLVAGITGGAYYENQNGQSRLASRYWDAFSIGSITAALLLLAGGIINTISALWSRRKQPVEEGG